MLNHWNVIFVNLSLPQQVFRFAITQIDNNASSVFIFSSFSTDAHREKTSVEGKRMSV